MSRLLALVLFLLVVPLLAGACGGGEEAAGLPEGFPQDFPIYENAAVAEALLSAEGDRFLVEWRTGDDSQQVVAFYQSELDREPWQVDNQVEIADEQTTVILFTRRDDPRQSGTVAVIEEQENGRLTKISLQLAVAE